MALVRIHNEDWGFETNCFVCEPTNSHGLQIPFFHDTEAGLITASLCLGGAYSGAPTLVHGGLTLAVLDEAMAWACIAIAHRWAVTVETTTRFERPVRIDTTYRVEARLAAATPEELQTTAQVLDARDRARASATATFAVLGEAQAVRVLGGANQPDQSYLRPE